eukprot:m.264603 g.264603  ORF g.264603 m.264603 type:complete len:498 (-) comp17624_c0_seq6:829-2322(-)
MAELAASLTELAEAQAQLVAVQEALAGDPTDASLSSLVDNLKELVGLLEAQVSTLQAEPNVTSSTQSNQTSATQSTQSAPLKLQPHEEQYRNFFANEDASIASGQLQDIKQRLSYHRLRWGEAIRPEVECLAPLPSADGQSQDYHQVVVVKVDAATQTCLVVFNRPMIPSMVPCRAYLRNACSKTADTCNHHHGMSVAAKDLKPFRTDPIEADSRCFYLTDDNSCWQRGTVYGLVDDTYAIVMPRGNHTTEPLTLPLKQVAPLPRLRTEDDDSDDNDDNDDSEDDRDTLYPAPDAYAHSAAFGTWETHTKGFGSKLMAKLGYVAGFGLGKARQGRVEPVAALMVPQGKSLDYIMDQREQGRLYNVGEKPVRKPKAKAKAKRLASRPQGKHTFFDDDGVAKATGQPTSKRNKLETATEVKASRADLVTMQLEIDELERQKATMSAQTALSVRHAQHQAVQLNHGVSTIDEEIKALKKKYRRLQTALDKHQTRSKLKIF